VAAAFFGEGDGVAAAVGRVVGAHDEPPRSEVVDGRYQVAAVDAGPVAESRLAVRAELLQRREHGVVPLARVEGRQPLPRLPLRVAGGQVEQAARQ
jgi:hypothetical protein